VFCCYNEIIVKIKLTNSLLILISLTALCFLSGCKHFNFDDPLTWRASLSGEHDITEKTSPGALRYNKEKIRLGISLEPDMTRVRILEEEKSWERKRKLTIEQEEESYKRKRLWEIEQAEERQKKLQIQQQQLQLQKQAETAKK
jgi:hypothetical protein